MLFKRKQKDLLASNSFFFRTGFYICMFRSNLKRKKMSAIYILRIVWCRYKERSPLHLLYHNNGVLKCNVG